ncbi:oxidoreductase [Rhodococcus pseudokoreensis]|uniref:Oxidoreductase n=1 Tax=Rhodococcus pseudokoreensis TaxID=2811421 RepID=A0A974W7F8_9NOCA|nr:PDR/VanB family oxidoreductase [Rhodococcus pseudokoreensis]QSE92610.1 oxidoreductase [Rhodococcus pseudokoreensis]
MTEVIEVTTTSTAVASELSVVVTGTTMLCEDIREVVLAPVGGGTLPSFTPGSHIAVTWKPGSRNSYSLTGPAIEPNHYSISVRLDPAGAGGSRWVHNLAVGDPITISGPRSAFAPVASARHHVLVAGGIGVTPILSHVRAAVQWGRSFEVIYSFRPGFGAHLPELASLCDGRLTTVHTPEQFWDNMTPALSRQPIGTHLYTCGPAPMIGAVAEAALARGWPVQRVHSEPFSSAISAAGEPFTATLARTGTTVPVGPDTSLLEALLDKGVNVPNLCRQGVCGECKLPVRSGRIEHRDLFLTDDEKDRGDALMPCVSRAAGALELDL